MKFLSEVQKFIINHPYYIANDGIFIDDSDADESSIEIHDPNRDYERLLIEFTLIA